MMERSGVRLNYTQTYSKVIMPLKYGCQTFQKTLSGPVIPISSGVAVSRSLWLVILGNRQIPRLKANVRNPCLVIPVSQFGMPDVRQRRRIFIHQPCPVGWVFHPFDTGEIPRSCMYCTRQYRVVWGVNDVRLHFSIWCLPLE